MKLLKKRTIGFVTAIVLAFCIPGNASRRKTVHEGKGSVEVGNVTRGYLLHVPKSLTKGQAVPLVLVFHGGGGHAGTMPGYTHFDKLADEQKFIVAYPESLNTHWSDTRGLSPADDVGFVRALIAELQRTQPVDPKRIYATGMSNGGFFSQRLACELSDQIAAVASVAATMPEPLLPVCKPSQPVSVMFILGNKDPLVSLDGGPVARTNGRSVSLAASASFWRNFNQTSEKATSADLPDNAHDGTRVHRDIYDGGQQGTQVIVYTIDGGGHTWPGAVQYLPKLLVGKASRNLDATKEIWNFFQQHRRE